MKNIKGVLCDIGGVLYIGDSAIDGAIEAIKYIKSKLPIRFITNTTQKTALEVVKKLQNMGFDIENDEVITALDVTKIFLKEHKSYAKFLLTDNALKFFDDLKVYDINYVVVGDAQDNFNYKNLNEVFRELLKDKELIAIAKNRYFKDSDNELSLDAGAFVAALEYASGKSAKILGKPSKDFFHLVCKDMGLNPNEALMIGDDIESDVLGAQKAGLKGVLVKTGKFQERDLQKGIKPDFMLTSIADIVNIL